MKQRYAFISYSSLNYSAALELKDILTSNSISCWMAPQSIPAGSDYATEIPKAIEECGVFILVLSKESQNSQWVPKELDLALTYGKPIIPFHMDDYYLKSAFNFRLTNIQRIEAYGRFADAYEELVRQIYALWDVSYKKINDCGSSDPSPKKDNKNGKTRIAVLTAVLVAVLVFAAAFLFLRHTHTWAEAACTTSKTCTTCGEIEGTPLNHSWQAATCTQASICLNCGITEGDPADHDWAPATTESPMTCRLCGATEGNAVLDVSIGGTITMGQYGNETIEWIVLEFDPATNQALLISKYCLDAIPFHAGSNHSTWENSTLRHWLNNNFISMAFTQEECASILTVQVSTPDNADYGTDSGNDTTDRVFLLSYEEAVYYFPSQTSRQGTPTAYCKAQGCYDPVKYAQENGTSYTPEEVGHTWWWLRTAGLDEKHTCNVISKGAASTYGAYQTSNEGTVRPVMWVQLG